jgi:hypothetical protein
MPPRRIGLRQWVLRRCFPAARCVKKSPAEVGPWRGFGSDQDSEAVWQPALSHDGTPNSGPQSSAGAAFERKILRLESSLGCLVRWHLPVALAASELEIRAPEPQFRSVACIIASFTGKATRRHGGPGSISIRYRSRSRFGETRTVMGHSAREAQASISSPQRRRRSPSGSNRPVDQWRPGRPSRLWRHAWPTRLHASFVFRHSMQRPPARGRIVLGLIRVAAAGR